MVSAGTPYWIAILGANRGTLRFRDGSRCRSENSQQDESHGPAIDLGQRRVVAFLPAFSLRSHEQITALIQADTIVDSKRPIRTDHILSRRRTSHRRSSAIAPNDWSR